MRIAFIGGGYMGEAIVRAALKDGFVQPGDIVVSDVASERRDAMAPLGVTATDDNAQAAGGADIVVFAVKPQEFPTVASGLRRGLNGSQTVLSIMAGVPMTKISEGLGHEAVARAMPNTAASVGEAISIWIAAPGVSEHSRDALRKLLGSMGRELEVHDEKYLDMATALSGSGPGFVFLFLEALIDAGVRIGLRRDVATELAVQTLVGSAALARQTGKHPAELRAMVTSPGGTTAAGLQVLEEEAFRGSVIAAVEAAYERAKELGG